MRYLFDNDISPHLAAMLRALDVDVTALRERWPSNTPDQEFLAALKDGEFDVYISHNTKQKTNPVERELLKQCGITVLYFHPFWGGLKKWGQAAWLTKHWPDIDDFCRVVARGTLADIQQNGKLKMFHL